MSDSSESEDDLWTLFDQYEQCRKEKQQLIELMKADGDNPTETSADQSSNPKIELLHKLKEQKDNISSFAQAAQIVSLNSSMIPETDEILSGTAAGAETVLGSLPHDMIPQQSEDNEPKTLNIDAVIRETKSVFQKLQEWMIHQTDQNGPEDGEKPHTQNLMENIKEPHGKPEEITAKMFTPLEGVKPMTVVEAQQVFKEGVKPMTVVEAQQVFKATIPLTATIPAGDIAHGIVWSYYYGYLALVLPGLVDRTKKSQFYGDPNIPILPKMVIVLPETCNCPGDVKTVDENVTYAGNIDFKATRSGKITRDYKTAVWKVKDPDNGQEFYTMLEYATPLLAMYEMEQGRITNFDSQEKFLQMTLFKEKLREILNHPSNPDCIGKSVIIQFKDEKEGGQGEQLSRVLAKCVRDELEAMKQKEVTDMEHQMKWTEIITAIEH